MSEPTTFGAEFLADGETVRAGAMSISSADGDWRFWLYALGFAP